MQYHDLRDFIRQLEAMGELKRVSTTEAGLTVFF